MQVHPGCCVATKDITIGGAGPISKAMLVCDLDRGHESLHLDEQDQVWWRPAESEDSPLEVED